MKDTGKKFLPPDKRPSMSAGLRPSFQILSADTCTGAPETPGPYEVRGDDVVTETGAENCRPVQCIPVRTEIAPAPEPCQITAADLSPVFIARSSTPTVEQLMTPPVEAGAGTDRDTTPYLTTEDLPEDWLELMAAEAKKGRGPTSMMRALGLTRAGFETILATSPEFAEAYDRCMLLSEEWWEDRGRDMACGEKGNGSVWIANMVNRWGWNSEKRLSTVNSSVGSGKTELTEKEVESELKRRGINLNLMNIVYANK